MYDTKFFVTQVATYSLQQFQHYIVNGYKGGRRVGGKVDFHFFSYTGGGGNMWIFGEKMKKTQIPISKFLRHNPVLIDISELSTNISSFLNWDNVYLCL